MRFRQEDCTLEYLSSSQNFFLQNQIEAQITYRTKNASHSLIL